MTIFKHEIKQMRTALLIWGIAVGLMILVSMIIYPEMVGNTADMFENMGVFTQAFGLDKLDINSVTGYYGMQSGSILALGGTFFASLIGISMLSKEESAKTAEFLLTHPISRQQVVIEKIYAIFFAIILFNLLCLLFSLISFAIINEMNNVVWSSFWLFHLAQCIMHIQIASLCFGISAIIKRGGIGIGIGFTMLMYFLNLICNISERVRFLKYITPFQYAEPSHIISKSSIDSNLIIVGVIYATIGIVVAFWYYDRKDIT